MPSDTVQPHVLLSLSHSQEVALVASLASLGQGSLIFQDGESLLQTINLCSTSTLALLVRLWLGDASILDLAVVLQDGAQLGVFRLSVSRELGDTLVKTLELLRRVFDVLFFGSTGHFVLLCGLFVLGLGIRLL